MYLEERIDKMEETITDLQKEIIKLHQRNSDEILTPKEFAHKAKLSENTVYCWIREGKIKVLPNLGTALRIPMSQFYNDEEQKKAAKAAVSQNKAEQLRKEFMEMVKNRKVE